MKNILQHSALINSHVPRLTTQQLKSELSKLEGQVTVQRDEIRDLENAHAARPYRSEFMLTMRRGYRDSLRQLHSEIASVRAMLQ